MKSVLFESREVFPSKVVCVGRNYVEHILELENEVPKQMVFFFKPNSSVSRGLVYPKNANTCHYEAEISFLIERNKIVAVAFGLDLTLRDVQSKLKEKSLPWERAKAFDNSAVFSDFVKIDDISDLEIELLINGKLKQKGNLSQMINKPKAIIEDFLSFSSFEDGDILMTGTPKGVGKFNIGDIFLGKIISKSKVIIEKEFKVS